VVAAAQLEDLPVGLIDFYSLGGLDSQKLRTALTSSYPPMRDIQLRMRELALAHEDKIFRVLHDASDDKQRAVAAHFAG
jgi:hypothetical protein